MFLKNVCKNTKNFSITARLTLFYSLSTILLISIVALFLYGAVVHTLHKANNEFLSSEVQILSKLLRNQSPQQLILEHKIIEVPQNMMDSSYHYYIRILDENNQTFLETPGMEQFFQQALFFKQTQHPLQQDLQRWQSENGQLYLLIHAPAIYGKTNQTWQIQIALDISYQQILLSQWRFILFLVLILFTGIAIISGFFIARGGMKSLNELTETTKKITADSLHQKIDPALWPTELKALGTAFNEMLARIEISFERLNQFSADLAHELRTPINNLMGQTEIALSNRSSIENYQQLLGSNLEELQRISQILDNLLFLARADNGQIDLTKTKLHVGKEIQFICDFYQSLADEKNIKLSCHGEGVISANSVMFRRMISNLLSNALKYCHDNGTIHFAITQKDQYVHIHIEDNGPGIAPGHLPHIFDRFYRIDSARSHQSGGTGLGLAIVKSIVELHKGIIKLDSVLNKGTVVSILLPHGVLA